MCDNLRCLKCGSLHHSTGNCHVQADIVECADCGFVCSEWDLACADADKLSDKEIDMIEFDRCPRCGKRINNDNHEAEEPKGKL